MASWDIKNNSTPQPENKMLDLIKSTNITPNQEEYDNFYRNKAYSKWNHRAVARMLKDEDFMDPIVPLSPTDMIAKKTTLEDVVMPKEKYKSYVKKLRSK